MMTENKCVKCGGVMRDGFIIDHGHYQMKQQQIWVEGIAEESFWSGLKTKGRQTYTVRSLRCAVCGYLEFYADDEVNIGSSLFT